MARLRFLRGAVIQTKGNYLITIFWISQHLIGWYRNIMLFEIEPICTGKEGMILQFAVTLHSEATLWIQLQERVNEKF